MGAKREKENLPNQYFEKNPSCESREREIHVNLGGKERSLLTDSGVFSASGLDKGTGVLLQSVPTPPPSSCVLDLGCGWGAISMDLAIKSPSCQIWALEINERAKELCKKNAEKLGIKNIKVIDEGQKTPDFDFIYSNPPVRIGKEAMRKLIGTWMARLKEGGKAYMVVNKHLGSDSLMAWMKEEGWKAQKIKSSKGYRVIEVCR